jgi:hypothetical protein
MHNYKLGEVTCAVCTRFLHARRKCDALCRVRTVMPSEGMAHIAGRTDGFTLAELVVSVGVLVILILLATQLLNSAASITTLGHKQMGADAQARQLLDRMAIDFAQMVKRSDVDYYLKSSAAAPLRRVLQPGNDQIAFYSAVPGYYPSSGAPSPMSLVAYRVYNPSPAPSPCGDCSKVQRMGKGLVWNAVSAGDIPIVFMPIPVASPIPVGELPNPAPIPLPAPAWPQAANMATDSAYEISGSQVFRFEYYYLLKGQTDPTTSTTYNPILTDIPWDTRISSCCSTAASTLCCHTAPEGMQDVAAIVADIAVIDPKSKALIDTVDPTGGKLARLNGSDGSAPLLADFSAGMISGQLLAQWRSALDANTVGLPPPAISGIRVYERYFYLSPPNLQTP